MGICVFESFLEKSENSSLFMKLNFRFKTDKYGNTSETFEIVDENRLVCLSSKKRWNAISIFEIETTVTNILN
jgi:C4-dicarboxylate-specific signal transduction histidine kinase